MLRLLAPLLLVFKVWMFVDAIRRNVATYWLWAIIFVPLGDVAYFFIVKLRDPGMRRMADSMLEGFKRPPPVEELEERYRTTPSINNRVALAQRLFDVDRYEESKEHFAVLLSRDSKNKEALYGLGLCRIELGDAAGAVEPLSRLTELHRSYRDYGALTALAEAHWRSDAREECLELMVDLVRAAPRFQHQLLRARYLERAGRRPEARDLLREQLREHARQPWRKRLQERPTASQAQELLAKLEEPVPARENA